MRMRRGGPRKLARRYTGWNGLSNDWTHHSHPNFTQVTDQGDSDLVVAGGSQVLLLFLR